MLLLKGHGTVAVNSDDLSAYQEGRAMTAAAACGFLKGYMEDPVFGNFGYYFPKAPPLKETPETTKLLDELAEATIQNDPKDRENSKIPPVFTYMGQFIDHDITANTDREAGVSKIDEKVVVPADRNDVSNQIVNLRFGSLNLDSLYGDAPNQGEVSKMLQNAMRWERDKRDAHGNVIGRIKTAKMEGGLDNERTHFPKFDQSEFEDPNLAAFPKDANRDLMRLGHARTEDTFDLNLLRNASPEIQEMFFDSDGKPKDRKAILGDGRNDENLAVAQFHLSMIRLHNELVDNVPANVKSGGTEAVFTWAQKMTRWIYQWLVVHAYLPAVCEPDTLKHVFDKGPVLYNELLNRVPPAHPDMLPLPLEFSVAAFRFGHSMARESYDWNRIFGRRPDGSQQNATFNLLFLFTGDGMTNGVAQGILPAGIRRLPGNWPIAWDRFVHPPTASEPDRSARKIDTHLNLDLGDMANESAGKSGVMKHLAKRNLRRGYVLNIPTAQGCLDALDAAGIVLPRLSEAQLLEGHTESAVKDGHFHTQTPLWFYVLKEAEMLAHGETLGPLGSLLVADTLLGLVAHTPGSYVHDAPNGWNWTPADSVTPNGVEITDMPSMMRAAGLM